jgi:peptidyl-prolyl cis-trans isomerase D
MYRFFRRNREAVKKYLLIFFLSIVSLGMVITLIPGLGSFGDNPMRTNVLASLNGTDITAQDLRQSIEGQLRSLPAGASAQLVSFMASSTLDNLVMQRVLLVQAKKMGIEASDQELLQALQSDPLLYQNGQFVGMDQYENVIQQQTGMSVAQFEAMLRQSIILDKMRDIITDGVQVTPEEVHQEYLRRNAKAKIAYVVFDPSQLLKEVKVSPEALQAYFQKNPSRYKLPEQRRLRYVLITNQQAPAQVSDQELREYYTQHLADYRVPDRVKVAHILFKTTGKSSAEIADVTKKARDVLAQVRAGGNFAELAKKYSEDTATAPNGGELGWIVRGQTVKEFETVAFSMKPGQVSDLIQTTYGIHIIRVEDRQIAHLQSFDEVKDSIRAKLEQEKQAAAKQALADNLVREIKAQPQKFVEIVRKAGLDPRETPLFRYNQAIPDLGNSEGLENLAFQLRTGEVGSLTVPKGTAVIQVAEIVPEHTPKLDEVRAQVEEDYRAEQSKVLAEQKAQAFAALCKREGFRKAAQDEGLTVKESQDFTQNDQVGDIISGSSLAAAFTLAPGQTSDVVSVGSTRVVFQVISHTPADEAGFASQREQLREQLLEQKRNLVFEIYQQNLKRQMMASGSLKINEAALKQFIAAYGGSHG